MLIPASCSACGLIFGDPNLVAGQGIVSFTNSFTVCPRCHSRARILDGIYTAIGDAVRVLATSEHSAATLRLLAGALTEATQRNATPEEIKATINEHAPELSSIADILPQTRNEVYQFVMALCAIIGALVLLFPRNAALTEQQTSAIADQGVKAICTGSAQTSPMNRHQRRAQQKKARHK